MKVKAKPTFLLLLSILMFIVVGCQPFPKDPQRTLDSVLERGMMRVGVADNTPWVTQQSSETTPDGVEVRLLTDFANELGVDISWYWGSAQSHLEALAHYELDVVIGGLTASNPWADQVGFTIPYYTSHIIVGVPPSQPTLSDLNGRSVAVTPLSGLENLLEDRGATVLIREQLVDSKVPIAAEAWQVEGLGFRRTEVHLQERAYVMAIPPGENGWLMQLENFLFDTEQTKIEDWLWEIANP